MRQRMVGSIAAAAVLAAGAWTTAAGQEAPSTPWGDPDLQGVWEYWTFTPLERPPELADRDVLTEEEAAAIGQRLSNEAVGRDDTRPAAGQTGGYNNNIQVFQAPGYVVLLAEMVHDVRVVPVDGRPHLPPGIRQWLGDSRGRWEGSTLVVETTNFTDKIASFSPMAFDRERGGFGSLALGTGESLRLVERFTRVDADTLQYEFTIDDPVTFTRPLTARLPMQRSDLPLYEYACHEGNYGLLNILLGARAEEGEQAVGASR